MSARNERAAQQKAADQAQERRVIRDTQGKAARDHYKMVKNQKTGSPWHRNKHNRKDGQ